jgi:hypothetical protein
VALVRRVVFSWWPLAVVACFARFTPVGAMEPVVTGCLGLFGLAVLLARFGPQETRRPALAFAVVGLLYLALVHGPGGTDLAGWSPSHKVCDRLARSWFPAETNPFGMSVEPYAAHAFRLVGSFITAWLLALVAARAVSSFGAVRALVGWSPRTALGSDGGS